jgi:hypothetical protein
MLEMFALHVRAAGLPQPDNGYVFLTRGVQPPGEVRFDFASPDRRIAVQIDHDQEKRSETSGTVGRRRSALRIFLFWRDGSVRFGAAIATVSGVFADELPSLADAFNPGGSQILPGWSMRFAGGPLDTALVAFAIN